VTTQAEVPSTWPGSDAAYVAYTALLRAGKEPGVDFNYIRGDEADFAFTDPPDLAMQVQESFYSHRSGIETRGTDVLAKAQLAGRGITLIMLGNDLLMQDPDWLIDEALHYRDHSRE
jgi:hypothetical protein